MMEAIILAGGLGTRLKPLTDDLPKPMIPIGSKPFLTYLLDYLIGEGVDKVILSVSFKHEIIVSYFGGKYRSIDIKYSVEEEPLGTGGAICLALKKVESDTVLIVNGDTYFKVSINKMRDFHMIRQSVLTLALKPMIKFSRYGRVVVDGDCITAFEEKIEKGTGLINGGLYLLNTNLFNGYNLPKKFSFEKEFLEPYVSNINPLGFVCNDYFIDIGVPDDYERAQYELESIK